MKNKLYIIITIFTIILLFSITWLVNLTHQIKQNQVISAMQDAEKNINKLDSLIDYKHMQDQINEASYANQIKKVYLTFDDGPSSITPAILDTLDLYDIKATFFINNPNGKIDILKRMIESGHTIGSHNYSHKYKTIYASDTVFWNDYNRLYDIVLKNTGYKIEIMRFPGGSANTVSRFSPGIMTRLTNMTKQRNIKYFDWNATNGDGNGRISPKQALNTAIQTSKNKNTIIILMHDGRGKKTTSEALPRIIEYYKSNGYIFDRITENTPQIIHHVRN